MWTVILIIVLILLIGFVYAYTKSKRMNGGLPTDYNGDHYQLVDYIMEAVHHNYAHLNTANVLDYLKRYNLSPEDTYISEKIIREIIFSISPSIDDFKEFNEVYVTLIEAMIACYFEKDCFLHDIKAINAGSYNSIVEVGCRKTGPKFDTLDIKNESINVLRIYKCRYNYEQNRTLSTKAMLNSVLMLTNDILDLLIPTGYVLKPIYGSIYMTKEEAPENMTLLWHMYPKLSNISIPMSKETLIDYLNAYKTIIPIIHKNGYVYGDWKIQNFMRHGDNVLLTDIEMTSIENAVKYQWLAISHHMPFNIREVNFDEESIIKIDNFAAIKEICSVLLSIKATPEEIDKVVRKVPAYRKDPKFGVYKQYIYLPVLPDMRRFGQDLRPLEVRDCTDEFTIEFINKWIRALMK